jgi:phosphoribosylformimino-5-aminoimidazole carboxamide ribotide isomerase
VRLKKGDFADATIYEKDPVFQAKKFEDQGATWLHVVDLDGAKDGAARQTEIISRIVRSTSLSVQVGGGIRSVQDIEVLLDCGAQRVVIGSQAATQSEMVQDWIKRFGGEHIVLALDVRLNEEKEPIILTRGWQEEVKKRFGMFLLSIRIRAHKQFFVRTWTATVCSRGPILLFMRR